MKSTRTRAVGAILALCRRRLLPRDRRLRGREGRRPRHLQLRPDLAGRDRERAAARRARRLQEGRRRRAEDAPAGSRRAAAGRADPVRRGPADPPTSAASSSARTRSLNHGRCYYDEREAVPRPGRVPAGSRSSSTRPTRSRARCSADDGELDDGQLPARRTGPYLEAYNATPRLLPRRRQRRRRRARRSASSTPRRRRRGWRRTR